MKDQIKLQITVNTSQIKKKEKKAPTYNEPTHIEQVKDIPSIKGGRVQIMMS